MSKTKTPFFGLGSQGTVGGVITSQKRGNSTLLRAKPIPTDPRSLPQVYQRWLYEDYVYLWHQQTNAVKNTYRTSGSRYHLTAFQYWMKYQLTNLQYLMAYYKLDDNLGATTIDSSRNGNTGTIIGASPADGFIGPCLSFDGINDWVRVPYSSSLDATDQISLFAWIKLDPLETSHSIFCKGNDATNPRNYMLWVDNRYLSFNFFAAGNYWGTIADTTQVLNDDLWHYVGVTYDRIRYRYYIDGTPRDSHLEAHLMEPETYYLQIGRVGSYNPLQGLLDHGKLERRILTPSEILNRSLRRYPLQ